MSGTSVVSITARRYGWIAEFEHSTTKQINIRQGVVHAEHAHDAMKAARQVAHRSAGLYRLRNSVFKRLSVEYVPDSVALMTTDSLDANGQYLLPTGVVINGFLDALKRTAKPTPSPEGYLARTRPEEKKTIAPLPTRLTHTPPKATEFRPLDAAHRKDYSITRLKIQTFSVDALPKDLFPADLPKQTRAQEAEEQSRYDDEEDAWREWWELHGGGGYGGWDV